jgi:protein unc-45
VTDMLKFLHSETDNEKRRQAANNLIVLAREKAGAELLMSRPQALEKMVKMLKEPNLDAEIRLTIVRTIGELLKGDPARVRYFMIFF